VSAARLALVAVLVVAVGVALHRVLIAMERRGWVYYRHRGRSSAAVGLGVLDEVFHPSAQIAVVQQQEQQLRGPRRPSLGDPPSEP
jgi:hypothetical protein